MKLCPRSARALGQPCDEQHARDWCIKMFNHDTCKDCSEGCRPNMKLLCELMPKQRKKKDEEEKKPAVYQANLWSF